MHYNENFHCLLIRVKINSENLVKIDLVHSEIISGIYQFWQYRYRSRNFDPRKLRSYWTIFAKFLHIVEKSLSFHVLKSELRSCNLLRNASVPNEGGDGQVIKFGLKIGFQGNVP